MYARLCGNANSSADTRRKSDKPRNKKAWRRAVSVAAYALEDDGHTAWVDALYYHADYVNPPARTYERIAKVGRHIFYRIKKG